MTTMSKDAKSSQEPTSPPTQEELFERVGAIWSKAGDIMSPWHAPVEAMFRPLTDAMLAAIPARAGTAGLDVACGTGLATQALARHLGPEALVVGTDLAPGMIAHARALATQPGMTGVRFEKAAAERLPFPDDHFDVITCRLGIMYFLDPVAALREMRRVLRPGGRIAFVTWGNADRSDWSRTTAHVMTPPDPNASPAPEGIDFRQPEVLQTLLTNAGFHNVAADARLVPLPWPGSVDDMVAFSLALFDLKYQSDHPGEVVDRDAAQRQDVMARMRAACAPFVTDQGLAYHAEIVVATAER